MDLDEIQIERLEKLSRRLKDLAAVSGLDAANYARNGGGIIMAECYAREAARLALDAMDLDDIIIEYRFAAAKQVN